MALNIAGYGINNQFVDGQGNPSNYAERSFNKKFPNSKISFPSNGYSGRFIPGTNGDIMGLNFKTGQFEQIRLIKFKTNAELVDGVLKLILETAVDKVINRIFTLPPIIVPPGLFNAAPEPPGFN